MADTNNPDKARSTLLGMHAPKFTEPRPTNNVDSLQRVVQGLHAPTPPAGAKPGNNVEAARSPIMGMSASKATMMVETK